MRQKQKDFGVSALKSPLELNPSRPVHFWKLYWNEN